LDLTTKLRASQVQKNALQSLRNRRD
jgi:hypothetical protein